MLGAGEKVSLFGRFRIAPRDLIVRRIHELGAETVKDLTRATTLFVVGSGAQNLLPDGRLGRRLAEARARDLPVIGEARLIALLDGQSQPEATVPLASIVNISDDLADALNAFDMIHLANGKVAFRDSDTLKNAARLEASGLPPAQILSALRRRRTAPRGRHQLKADDHGQPVLEWDDGVTNLAGQGMLPLGDSDTLDALFEAGLEAELAGDLDSAARVYETCALSDKRDPIAPYNLGNVRAAQGKPVEARMAYERALSRDPSFAEAHFNLAGLLEREGDIETAITHLKRATDIDPRYPEPVFNLAQLAMSQDRLDEAERYYRTFLQIAENSPLEAKAQKALHLIGLHKSA